MTAYYNEIDPFKAEVLREALEAGAIAPGDVDERSIADVRPDELRGYRQCHFFAGGGFWSLALRQAGWPDDREVWTGSCPCPSFSAAGKGEGFADPRHLWPEWIRLIRERRPGTIFGEQVAAAIGHGWLDLVSGDLEAEGYAVAAAVLGAHSVGAPHIRQRLYFVAESQRERSWPGLRDSRPAGIGRHLDSDGRGAGSVGIAKDSGLQECELHAGSIRKANGSPAREGLERGSDAGRLGNAGEPGSSEFSGREFRPVSGKSCGQSCPGEPRGLANADGADPGDGGLQRSGELVQQPQDGGVGSMAHTERDGRGSDEPGRCQDRGAADGGDREALRPSPLNGFWRDVDWIGCRDGKWRPVKPGTFPLAHGYPGRVGLLRLAGDAICVPAAQAFIEAYLTTDH